MDWSMYQEMPHEQVNWAALAQQWMAMRGNEEVYGQGQQQPSEIPMPYDSKMEEASEEGSANTGAQYGSDGNQTYSEGYLHDESWRGYGASGNGGQDPPPPPPYGNEQHSSSAHPAYDQNYQNAYDHMCYNANGEYVGTGYQQPGANGSTEADRPMFPSASNADSYMTKQHKIAPVQNDGSPEPLGLVPPPPVWPPPPGWMASGLAPLMPPMPGMMPMPGMPPPPFYPPSIMKGMIPPGMFGDQSNMAIRKLPAWIKEGLEKAERDRTPDQQGLNDEVTSDPSQWTSPSSSVSLLTCSIVRDKIKKEEKEAKQRALEAERQRRRAAAGKGKFDSDSEEEGEDKTRNAVVEERVDSRHSSPRNAEADDERSPMDREEEDERTDEEKKEDAIYAMRFIMTTLLLETTDEVMMTLISETLQEERKGSAVTPKLLASSSALAALSALGDEEDSDEEESAVTKSQDRGREIKGAEPEEKRLSEAVRHSTGGGSSEDEHGDSSSSEVFKVPVGMARKLDKPSQEHKDDNEPEGSSVAEKMRKDEKDKWRSPGKKEEGV